MNKLLTIVSLACLMSACGANVREDFGCGDRDWGKFGTETAMAGKSVRMIDTYREQCVSGFSQVNLDDYLDSYSRALINYCTYDNGYAHGSNDKKSSNICPQEIEKLYVKGYEDGQRDRFVKLQELEKIRDSQEQDHLRENRKRNSNRSTQPDIPGAGAVKSW